MKKKLFFVCLSILYLSHTRTNNQSRSKLEYLPNEDFNENEVVIRKRVEDLLKWKKRYLDEINASKNIISNNSKTLNK